ncbi:hypothetical protein BC829DRAFT_176322 [Chytridium lagenaria]|nr:hypothetical protein BC829DRAFT_176322 [Chytridium lagenaria]
MSRVPHQDPFSASLLEGIHLPRHPSPYAASSPAVSTINNEVFGSSTVKPSMKKTYKKRKPPEGSQSASSSVKSSTLKNGGSNDEGNKENMNPLVAKPLFQKDQHCGRKSVSIVSPLMPKPPLLAVRQDLRHGVHALASAPKSHESMSSMFFSGLEWLKARAKKAATGNLQRMLMQMISHLGSWIFVVKAIPSPQRKQLILCHNRQASKKGLCQTIQKMLLFFVRRS